MTELVRASKEGHILTLALNRPDRKNAISLAMYTTLAENIEAAGNDGTRVIVLSGEGENFTSGNDLADFANAADVTNKDNPIARFIDALSHCPIPVVVAVQGVAVGIGTTLLLHSDLVFADKSAKFRLPFANLGLCPEFASSYLLPRLVGHVKAAEWLMLGEFFSAEDALEGKLINAIVENPLQMAQEKALALSNQAPSALRATKKLLKQTSEANVQNIIQSEYEAFGFALKGPEFAEAAAAFFEKRAPDFSKF